MICLVCWLCVQLLDNIILMNSQLFVNFNFMAMHSPKQNRNPECRQFGKFLIRHNSAASFPIFEACCSTTETYDIEMEKTPMERQHSRKLSMKNLLRKSNFLVDKTPCIFSQNRSCYTAKQVDNHSMQYIHSRKTSQIRDGNISVKDQKMENRAASRISFNYKKERVEPPSLINNYNTTNYIVEKYIVQPQEMNIIMKDKQNTHQTTNHQPTPQPTYQPTQDNSCHRGRYFDLSAEFEEQEKHLQTPKWNTQTYSFANEANSLSLPTKNHQNGGNYHFSFGQNQRKDFLTNQMNMSMKEALSKRQSENSKQRKPRLSFQVQQFKPNQLKVYTEQEYPLLKNSFKKTNLSNYEQDGLKIIVSQVSKQGVLPKKSQVIDNNRNQVDMKKMLQLSTKKKYAG